MVHVGAGLETVLGPDKQKRTTATPHRLLIRKTRKKQALFIFRVKVDCSVNVLGKTFDYKK